MRRRMLLLAALLALPGQAAAPAGPEVNTEGGVGLGGFDPVAYFTEGRAVRGLAQVAAAHDGVEYRFASGANRAAFLADPARFLPQYGGFCAFAVARGYKAVVDPTAFAVVDGRLYLNYNADIQAQWQRGQARDIWRGDANWPQVKLSRDVAR